MRETIWPENEHVESVCRARAAQLARCTGREPPHRCGRFILFRMRFAPVSGRPLGGEDMASPKRLNAITLGPRQWLLLSVVTLVVLPVVLIVTFLPQVETAFVRQFVLPRWERQFGFVHGTTTLQMGNSTRQVFAIVSVVPNGTFNRARVLPGDVPVGYQHGFESGFYRDLARLESEHVVTLHFLNARTLARRSVRVTSP